MNNDLSHAALLAACKMALPFLVKHANDVLAFGRKDCAEHAAVTRVIDAVQSAIDQASPKPKSHEQPSLFPKPTPGPYE